MAAKGDWGCRPFPLMQSPSPRPTKPQIAVAADLNSRYNPPHPAAASPLSFRLIFQLEKRGGEVSIDTSPVEGDPEATIQKARQIQAAANAPAEPSSQDRSVAAKASQLEQAARLELIQEQREKQASEFKERDNVESEVSRRVLDAVA